MKHVPSITVMLFLTLLHCSLSSHLMADEITDQIATGKKQLIQAVSELDEVSMRTSLIHFETLLKRKDKEWLIQLYLGYAKFRLGNFFSTIKNDDDQSVRYFDEALVHLDKSQRLNPNSSEPHIIRSATYGSKIKVSPWKGVFLGRRAEDEIRKALEMEPTNPRAWLHRGIAESFTPGLFGGGKKVAMKSLKKSLDLYKNEKNLSPEHLQWGEDEAHIWIGIIYKDWGQMKESKASYDAALELNPKNRWLTDVLIPDLARASARP